MAFDRFRTFDVRRRYWAACGHLAAANGVSVVAMTGLALSVTPAMGLREAAATLALGAFLGAFVVPNIAAASILRTFRKGVSPSLKVARLEDVALWSTLGLFFGGLFAIAILHSEQGFFLALYLALAEPPAALSLFAYCLTVDPAPVDRRVVVGPIVATAGPVVALLLGAVSPGGLAAGYANQALGLAGALGFTDLRVVILLPFLAVLTAGIAGAVLSLPWIRDARTGGG